MKNNKKLPTDPTPTPPPHAYPYYSYVSAWEGDVRRGWGGGVRRGGGGGTWGMGVREGVRRVVGGYVVGGLHGGDVTN